QDVVLHRAGDLFRRTALLLRHELVQEQKHRSGGIDGHRGRDPIERDVLEKGLHVLERVDRDADLADLAVGHRVVGVVADLRRQVERDRKPGLALLEQEAVALVRLRGGAEAGVLPHRPEAAAIHVLVDATREGERARERLFPVSILGRVDRFQGQAAVVLNFLHVSTNSVSTPPTLLGCTKAIRVPCRPIRGSSSIISRPRARALAIACSMSGTATAMWCRPGPRLATNLPTGVSSRRGFSSSTSASPARRKAASRPSFSFDARCVSSAPKIVVYSWIAASRSSTATPTWWMCMGASI